MRAWVFAGRVRKEILRDPMSLIFGLGLPLVLIAAIQLMARAIPGMSGNFKIDHFAPGMAVFAQSFIALFLGMLVSGDRGSAFLTRLFASPLRDGDYLAGYGLPMLLIALVQGAVCFALALCFGMQATPRLLLALVALLPAALLFVALGLLIGSCLSGPQVGGAASILVNVAAWLSGVWFPLDLIGGAFRAVCYALPFAHAVDAVKAVLSGDWAAVLPHLAWVMAYAAVCFALAVWLFHKKRVQ